MVVGVVVWGGGATGFLPAGLHLPQPQIHRGSMLSKTHGNQIVIQLFALDVQLPKLDFFYRIGVWTTVHGSN